MEEKQEFARGQDEEVKKIMRYLGQADLKILYSIQRRRRLYGVLFVIIGFGILLGSSVYSMLYPTAGFMWVFIGFVFGFAIMRQGFASFYEAKKVATPGGGRYRIFVRLACTNADCEYKTQRPYKSGEYVGMILSELCPKCSSPLRIEAIFGKPQRKIKTMGIPLLPTAGSQTKTGILSQIKGLVYDYFAPFKVAFKWFERADEKTG